MRIVVIDGQGGRMGRAVIDILKSEKFTAEIIAVGTNSAATEAMLAAKPDACATGENAVIVNSKIADYIIGPIGIVMADALHGEISPNMALAISQSQAKKILLPVTKCNATVIGTREIPFSELLKLIPKEIEG